MKNTTGDLFQTPAQAVVITTNGFVKSNGEAVMGKGCAKQVQKVHPYIAKVLGKLIINQGNHTHLVFKENFESAAIVSFPVKPITDKCNIFGTNVVEHKRDDFNEGAIVPGWACVADKELIIQSAKELVVLTDRMGWTSVLLPRAGCGAGELEWSEVEPLLQEILDDRFTAITFK